MAEEKNSKKVDYMPIALISIVAIVAIVGVAVLFMDKGTAAQSTNTANYGARNVAGNEYDPGVCESYIHMIQIWMEEKDRATSQNDVDMYDRLINVCNEAYNRDCFVGPQQAN